MMNDYPAQGIRVSTGISGAGRAVAPVSAYAEMLKWATGPTAQELLAAQVRQPMGNS